jgi:hypothetical protein
MNDFRLCSSTTQETGIFVLTAVRTSHPTWWWTFRFHKSREFLDSEKLWTFKERTWSVLLISQKLAEGNMTARYYFILDRVVYTSNIALWFLWHNSKP